MAIMTKDWEAFSAVAYAKECPWSKAQCKVGELIASLDEEHKKLVISVVEDKTISGHTLWKALQQIGYLGGRTTVHEHRRASCPCYRGTE